MKQPQLGDDIAALTVSSGQAEADRMPRGSVPRFPQSLQFGGARRCLRNKLRQRGRGKRDRLEVGRQRGPKPPGVGRKNVETAPARRQHPPDFGVHARKIGNMLQHVRRENDVDAGIGQGDAPAIVISDGEDTLRCVVRVGDLNRGNVETPALEFQGLLAGPRSEVENARPRRKEGDNLVDFRQSDGVEVIER